jgi:Domain of unknown function (DUF4124)
LILGGKLSSLIVLVFALALLGGAAAAGEIYRWRDSAGTVHFSDTPPPKGEAVSVAKFDGSIASPTIREPQARSRADADGDSSDGYENAGVSRDSAESTHARGYDAQDAANMPEMRTRVSRLGGSSRTTAAIAAHSQPASNSSAAPEQAQATGTAPSPLASSTDMRRSAPRTLHRSYRRRPHIPAP